MQIGLDVADAKDNLLAAKITQAEQANKSCGPDFVDLNVGDRVKLSTDNRHRIFMKKGDNRVAKFMARFDGPYEITAKHAECSTFTLHLPNQPNIYNVFHVSELEPWNESDVTLLPSRDLPEPDPIISEDSEEEYYIDQILDERVRRRGKQYLVRFTGYGPKKDLWLPGRNLVDAEALDIWEARSKD
jgi:hypothetical protein